MDCTAVVRTIEAHSVGWSAMPWTVTSVEQHTSGQDRVQTCDREAWWRSCRRTYLTRNIFAPTVQQCRLLFTADNRNDFPCVHC